MKLLQLQKQFLSSLRKPQSNKVILDSIAREQRLTVKQKLDIYRTSLQENLIKALRNTFPICCQIVGESFFRAMAKKYSEKIPSRSFDLGCYGAEFSWFIKNFKSAKTLPYLPEVAKLEWVLHQLSRAKDESLFDFTSLAKVTETQQPRLTFRLIANSVILTSRYPLKQIWQIHQPDYHGELSVDFDVAPTRLFIYRKNFLPQIQELSRPEWQLLKTFTMGKTLAQLTAAQIALVPVLIERGWLGGFCLRE